jgi:hypothetical protein
MMLSVVIKFLPVALDLKWSILQKEDATTTIFQTDIARYLQTTSFLEETNSHQDSRQANTPQNKKNLKNIAYFTMTIFSFFLDYPTRNWSKSFEKSSKKVVY